MKIKGLLFILIVLLFVSCESTPKEVDVDPDFIGNFNPFQLENIICVKETASGISPVEIRVFFVPRTNIVEMYLRDGMTTYVLLLEGEERKQLFEGISQYAQAYGAYTQGETGALENREPTRKNSFNSGTMSVSWGVASASRNNTTVFYTNYKYLEERRPYFELLVDKTKDKDNSSVFSPVLRLYFSPTHLDTFIDTLGQERLVQLVEELEAEAFAF